MLLAVSKLLYQICFFNSFLVRIEFYWWRRKKEPSSAEGTEEWDAAEKIDNMLNYELTMKAIGDISDYQLFKIVFYGI